MKFLCFGAGAIGTYIGGSLLMAGQDVVFLERPEVVSELKNRGLSLTIHGEEQRVNSVNVVGSLADAFEFGPFHAGIFAIKSFDTALTMEESRDFLGRMPPLVCLQNGIDNELVLESYLGADRVIAGTVTSAIGRKAIGSIQLERLRGVGISSQHPLSRQIVEVFNLAGLHARPYINASAMKWSKLMTNLLANASSAILNMTPLEIYSDPILFDLEVRMLKELLQVMQAQRIPVINLPGTPSAWLARLINLLPMKLSQIVMKKSLGSGRGGKMPSFHIDLYAGRKQSEVEFLNGAVVRAGKRLGISTPVNKVLTDTLMQLAQGKLQKEAFARQPEKILQILKEGN